MKVVGGLKEKPSTENALIIHPQPIPIHGGLSK